MDHADATRGLGLLHARDAQHHGGIDRHLAFVKIIDYAATHDDEGRLVVARVAQLVELARSLRSLGLVEYRFRFLVHHYGFNKASIRLGPILPAQLSFPPAALSRQFRTADRL